MSALAPARLLAGLTVVAVVATAVAVVLTGQQPAPAPAGLTDAGPAVGWAVLVGRTTLRCAAVVSVGALLVACLLPAGVAPTRLLRTASLGAVVWLLAVVVSLTGTSAELLGVPISRMLTSGEVWAYAPRLDEGRALLLTLPLVLAVAMHAPRLRTPGARLVGLAGALLALVPLALSGHAANAAGHYVASQSLLLHVLAATVWVGGLVGLLLVPREVLAPVAHRYSTVALGCFVVTAASGAVAALARLGLGQSMWLSSYGALVIAKVALLVLLGAAGAWHRGVTLRALERGARSAFARLAAAEIVVMGVAMGLGVALSRTAPPVRLDAVASPHPVTAVDRTLPSPSLDTLLTELVTRWRPDAVVVTLVVGLVALGLSRRRPVARVLLAGAATGWLLLGAPAAYQSASMATFVAQILACLLVVPRLLRWAAVDMDGDADGDVPAPAWVRRTARWSGDPVNAALLTALLLAALLASPLTERVLEGPTLHLGTTIVVVVIGLLLAAQPQPGAPLAVAGVLAAFGAGMLTISRTVAATWWEQVPLDWLDPVVAQDLAGAVLLLAAAALAATGLRPSAAPRPPAGRAAPRGRRSAPAVRS